MYSGSLEHIREAELLRTGEDRVSLTLRNFKPGFKKYIAAQ